LNRFELYVLRVMGYRNQWVRCGAGRTFMGVGPDGALYPCMRFAGIDRYRIGKLPGGIDEASAAAFRHGAGRPYLRRTPCRSCWAAPLCCGPCFACAELLGERDGRPNDDHCAYRLADASAAVWLVQELRRRDPERLLEFLPIST
jgi:radical SAM protein with 4Fe4S-binding SPASM domain